MLKGVADERGPVARALLDFARQIDPFELFPSHDPRASRLVAQDPSAFAMALCLDRQTKAETIWTIPYDVQASLGHLDPARIVAMTLADLESLFRRLPHKPRFVNDAPQTVSQLSKRLSASVAAMPRRCDTGRQGRISTARGCHQ